VGNCGAHCHLAAARPCCCCSRANCLAGMPSSSSTRRTSGRGLSSADGQDEEPASASCFPCSCFGTLTRAVVHEAQMVGAALTAAPPLELKPGHANEEGEARGMAPPCRGAFEVVNMRRWSNRLSATAFFTTPGTLTLSMCSMRPVCPRSQVNKNKNGEIVAILVAGNVQEMITRDIHGTLNDYLIKGSLPEGTVISGEFDKEAVELQVALFYGAKYRSTERMLAGDKVPLLPLEGSLACSSEAHARPLPAHSLAYVRSHSAARSATVD